MNQRKSEVIFAHQNLISNWLTYLDVTADIIGDSSLNDVTVVLFTYELAKK